MTTILRWFCVLTIVVACGFCLPAKAAVQHEHMAQMNTTPMFEQEMMESMKKMDRDLMAAPMTGNPDSDFSAMMILHHQGAIDMAKAFLLHGKDPVLLRLAQEIIVTQQQEIEMIRLRRSHCKPAQQMFQTNENRRGRFPFLARTESIPPTRPRTPFR